MDDTPFTEQEIRITAKAIRDAFIAEKSKTMGDGYKLGARHDNHAKVWRPAAVTCLGLRAEAADFVAATFYYASRSKGMPYASQLTGKYAAKCYLNWLGKKEEMGRRPGNSFEEDRFESNIPLWVPTPEENMNSLLGGTVAVMYREGGYGEDGKTITPRGWELLSQAGFMSAPPYIRVLLAQGLSTEVSRWYGQQALDFFAQNPAYLEEADNCGFNTDHILECTRDHLTKAPWSAPRGTR